MKATTWKSFNNWSKKNPNASIVEHAYQFYVKVVRPGASLIGGRRAQARKCTELAGGSLEWKDLKGKFGYSYCVIGNPKSPGKYPMIRADNGKRFTTGRDYVKWKVKKMGRTLYSGDKATISPNPFVEQVSV